VDWLGVSFQNQTTETTKARATFWGAKPRAATTPDAQRAIRTKTGKLVMARQGPLGKTKKST
jgi:hypothetical protein